MRHMNRLVVSCVIINNNHEPMYTAPYSYEPYLELCPGYETLAQKTILHIKKVQEWLGGVCVHGVLRCALIQNRHQLQRKSLRVQVATEGTSAGLR